MLAPAAHVAAGAPSSPETWTTLSFPLGMHLSPASLPACRFGPPAPQYNSLNAHRIQSRLPAIGANFLVVSLVAPQQGEQHGRGTLVGKQITRVICRASRGARCADVGSQSDTGGPSRGGGGCGAATAHPRPGRTAAGVRRLLPCLGFACGRTQPCDQELPAVGKLTFCRRSCLAGSIVFPLGAVLHRGSTCCLLWGDSPMHCPEFHQNAASVTYDQSQHQINVYSDRLHVRAAAHVRGQLLRILLWR